MTILWVLVIDGVSLFFFGTDSSEPEGGGGSQKVRSMCVSGYLLLYHTTILSLGAKKKISHSSPKHHLGLDLVSPFLQCEKKKVLIYIVIVHNIMYSSIKSF